VQLDLDLRDGVATFARGDASDCPAGSSAVTLTRHRTLPVITLAVGEPAVPESYVLDTGNRPRWCAWRRARPTPPRPGWPLPGGHRLTPLPRATIGAQIRSAVPVVRVAAPALAKTFEGRLRGLAGTAFIDGARWRSTWRAISSASRRSASPRRAASVSHWSDAAVNCACRRCSPAARPRKPDCAKATS
jgi:hypothetical protein